MMCGTMDGFQVQRGSGKSYNSKIGSNGIVGGQTKKVIGLEVMRKECRKCDVVKKHPTCLCMCNYQGSSKGMELTGAVRNALNIFENYNAYLQTLVTDDDAATKRLL